MVSKKCVVNYPMFTLFIVVFSVNLSINSALRTVYVEELCYGTGKATIDLSIQKSVILSSVPSDEQDCQILVKTPWPSSLVVAFYRYHLYGNDSLVFTDRHSFKLALEGEGYFVDERKSVILETPVNIHYYTQYVRADTKLKFQIVLTQVFDNTCNYDEYKCENNKCIPKELACDQHNHCGDLTHQNKCSPNVEDIKEEKLVVPRVNVFIIAIAVGSVVLLIVIIVIIVGVVRLRANKKKAQLPTLPTVAAVIEPPKHPQASVFSRLRQSFRGLRQPTAPPTPDPAGQLSESQEVPSMYPNLPSDISRVDNQSPDSTGQYSESQDVPSMYPKLQSDTSGVDNPDFKHDE